MNEELQELLRFPREDLDIELKQWMDIQDKSVQAKFAKELLALRNHGGEPVRFSVWNGVMK